MFTIKVDHEITLHLIQENHHHDLFTLIETSRDHLREHMGANLAQDKAEVHQLCLRSKKLFAENGAIITLITYQGKTAGLINIQDRTGEGISGAEIGYWLGKDFIGKGIITRAAKTLTDYAFKHWDVQRVFLGIATDNPRSIAVAERLGFTIEGTLRQNDKINGKWVDHQIYTMLKQEWQHPQEPPILRYQLDDRLDLRLVEKQHAQTIFDACNANREHIGKFLPWIDNTKSVDDTMGFVEESLTQYGNNDGWQAGIWHDNQLVGMIGYLFWNTVNHHTEIGYWLAESATGQGIMTRCARELTRYAFETVKLNRVVIRCDVDNHASAGVAKRLGYQHEGIERQGIKSRDRYVNVHVYSLLAEEWQNS